MAKGRSLPANAVFRASEILIRRSWDILGLFFFGIGSRGWVGLGLGLGFCGAVSPRADWCLTDKFVSVMGILLSLSSAGPAPVDFH